MRCTQKSSRVHLTIPLGAALLVAGGLLPADVSLQPPLLNTSCFTIGAVVECIDAGFILPPMIVPGTAAEGTDESITIEDNGGYHEVRG